MSARSRTKPRWRQFAPDLQGTHASLVPGDLLAGATVAAVAVPQAIAYAFVAGLPPEMGLIAAALPCAWAALFGSSPHLVTGPTNPTALVLGLSVVAPAVAATGAVPIQGVLATGLLCGAMLAAFGLLGVGRVSRFLSDSVVIGFSAGAGLLIAFRLVPALDPTFQSIDHPGGLAPHTWPVFYDAARALLSASPRAVGLAVVTPLAVLALRLIDPRIPAALITLAGVTFATSWLGWTTGQGALAVVGPIQFDWSLPHWPVVGRYDSYTGPAFALALLVTVQSIAAARSVRPPESAQRLDPDRELFSQGIGNLISGLWGGMITSGSLTRSAIARSSGGHTRLAALTSGVLIALGLPFLSTWISPIPMAALVGIVFLSGIQLIQPTALRRATTTRGDALVLIGTFLATLWIDLVDALYVGVFLSLALLIRRSGRLQISELVETEPGRFAEQEIDPSTGKTPVVLLHLEGDLNFAVAETLSERLGEISAHHPAVVILRMKRVTYLDATVLESLRAATQRLAQGGTRFLLCGLTHEQLKTLEGTELAQTLGEEGLLPAGPRLFDGFEQAIERARELVRSSSEASPWRTHDQSQ
ncbi:MAG: SulP family inorganic anion transporter [Myxococcota bacterium]|nr:SulP family inorganic anion transporter [Myxococcota bacterium]